MQAALQLFERLTAEIPREEKEFPKIRQQYETLGKALNARRKVNNLAFLFFQLGFCSRAKYIPYTI